MTIDPIIAITESGAAIIGRETVTVGEEGEGKYLRLEDCAALICHIEDGVVTRFRFGALHPVLLMRKGKSNPFVDGFRMPRSKIVVTMASHEIPDSVMKEYLSSVSGIELSGEKRWIS